MDELEKTVTQHITALRRYAITLAGDHAEADDLVQESLTRALTGIKRVSNIRDLRAYLFTVLHNVSIDQHRRQRRAVDRVMLDDVAWEHGVEASQERRLEVRDLRRALRQLPEEQRNVILLVGVGGMSYKETASILNIAMGTVMSRLFRGRENLRRMLGGERLARLRRVK